MRRCFDSVNHVKMSLEVCLEDRCRGRERQRPHAGGDGGGAWVKPWGGRQHKAGL